MDTKRRTILTATGLAAVAATGALAIGTATAQRKPKPVNLKLPKPTGPYPVGRTDLHIVDDSRPDPWVPEVGYRELMVTLWYPARAATGHDRGPWIPRFLAEEYTQLDDIFLGIPAGSVNWAGLMAHARVGAPASRGRFPVLLYASGHFKPRFMWTTMGEDLASRGFVVAAIDHTYEVRTEFPGGRIVEPEQPSQLPEDPIPWLLKTVKSWSADASSTLDALEALSRGENPDADGKRLPSGLCEAVDASRAGGICAPPGGGLGAMQHAYDDPRVAAVYTPDSGLTFDTRDGRKPIVTFHEDGLERPLLVMRPSSDYEAPDPLFDDFFERCSGPKWELEPRGTGGRSQTDFQSLLPQIQRGLDLPADQFAPDLGDIDPKRSLAAQRAYAAAFFDRHLRNGDGELLDGPSDQFPEVRFVRT